MPASASRSAISPSSRMVPRSGSRHHDATAPPGGFHRCGGIVEPLDCIERSARETLYSSGIVNARSAATKQSSGRSEEHTSELQSLMRFWYAVFCLKKNTSNIPYISIRSHQLFILYPH